MAVDQMAVDQLTLSNISKSWNHSLMGEKTVANVKRRMTLVPYFYSSKNNIPA